MEPMEHIERIPDNRSVIVVSDLHLGLKGHDTVVADFLDFLAFLKRTVSDGHSENPDVLVHGKPRKLFPPEKIILLGDIIDLWSPRNDNRASVLADSYLIIQFLLSFPAEIVYVAGNHDDEISEIEGSFPVSGPGKLKIIKRHYPDTPPDKDGIKKHQGIGIGNHRYFFMHGQQFDLLFNIAGLLQNYPGWVAKNYSLFRDHGRFKWLFRAIFAISAIYLVLANMILGFSTVLDGMVYFLLGLSMVIFLFTIEPSIFRDFWDTISLRKKVKTETIKTIIENGFWKKEAGENIQADSVVFGHTHVADDSKDRYLQEYHKRFINSGSWGDEEIKKLNDTGEAEKNTFVYIDAGGPVLFCWPDKGPLPQQVVTTLTGDPTGAGPHLSRFKLLIRQTLFSRG
jgi:UDP-2,3-diacylglucosamine pyrophosphatase LpxH